MQLHRFRATTALIVLVLLVAAGAIGVALDDGGGTPTPIAGPEGSDEGDSGTLAGSRKVDAEQATSEPAPVICAGTLAGVITGGVVDLAASGLVPNLLPASAYELREIKLLAERDCEDGDEQRLILNTAWHTVDGRFRVSVMQRQGGEPAANVLYASWAEFWHDGSAYSVFTSRYPDDSDEGKADDGADPDRAALLAAIDGLAPGLEAGCFHRALAVAWEHLEQFGLGDPHDALPAGFRRHDVRGHVLTPPAEECESAARAVPLFAWLKADWADGRGGWIQADISLPASLAATHEPGYQSDYSISWSSERYRYEVSGDYGAKKREQGLGAEALMAIALALDPQFASSCRLIEGERSDESLSQAGIGIPHPPRGFTLQERRSLGVTPNRHCGAEASDGQTISAVWVFDGDGGVITASAWKPAPGDAVPDDPGSAGEDYLRWTGPQGIHYTVSGTSGSGSSQGAGRETLIAVARSMDASFEAEDLPHDPWKSE